MVGEDYRMRAHFNWENLCNSRKLNEHLKKQISDLQYRVRVLEETVEKYEFEIEG